MGRRASGADPLWLRRLGSDIRRCRRTRAAIISWGCLWMRAAGIPLTLAFQRDAQLIGALTVKGASERNELLQPLMIDAQPLRHRLHRLTPPVRQQATHIQLTGRPLIAARQPAQHASGELHQPGPDLRDLLKGSSRHDNTKKRVTAEDKFPYLTKYYEGAAVGDGDGGHVHCSLTVVRMGAGAAGERGAPARGGCGHDVIPVVLSGRTALQVTAPGRGMTFANDAGPRRNAAAPPSPAAAGSWSRSVPAARMPLTVR